MPENTERSNTRKARCRLNVVRGLLALTICVATFVSMGPHAAGQSSAPRSSSSIQELPDSRDGTPTPSQNGQNPAPATSQPGAPAASGSSAPDSQANPAPPGNPPQDEGTAPGAFVFRAQAEEVVLHATVVDADNRPVTGLPKSAFTVYEDGQPQKIRSFRTEDVPVALGILIDNSGSMRTVRASVNRAAISLVKASNPRDGVFIVNFGENSYLDQDFTSDIPKLQEALDRIGNRGTTAIYDTLVASANHLEVNVKSDKKILLLITDGADNASKETLRQTLQQLQKKNGPIVYVIALLRPSELEARSTLEAIARETGGTAFFPASAEDAGTISATLARDIRSQYTLSYSPTTSRAHGKYHTIRVVATSPTGQLQVRTRTGYYSGQELDQESPEPPGNGPTATSNNP